MRNADSSYARLQSEAAQECGLELCSLAERSGARMRTRALLALLAKNFQLKKNFQLRKDDYEEQRDLEIYHSDAGGNPHGDCHKPWGEQLFIMLNA